MLPRLLLSLILLSATNPTTTTSENSKNAYTFCFDTFAKDNFLISNEFWKIANNQWFEYHSIDEASAGATVRLRISFFEKEAARFVEIALISNKAKPAAVIQLKFSEDDPIVLFSVGGFRFSTDLKTPIMSSDSNNNQCLTSKIFFDSVEHTRKSEIQEKKIKTKLGEFSCHSTEFLIIDKKISMCLSQKESLLKIIELNLNEFGSWIIAASGSKVVPFLSDEPDTASFESIEQLINVLSEMGSPLEKPEPSQTAAQEQRAKQAPPEKPISPNLNGARNTSPSL